MPDHLDAPRSPDSVGLDRGEVIDVSDGDFGFAIAGSGFYLDSLMGLLTRADEQTQASGEWLTQAVLVPDPDNRFDARAIEVRICDRVTGFIPAHLTTYFHPLLRQLPTHTLMVPAVLLFSSWGGTLHEESIRVLLDVTLAKVRWAAADLAGQEGSPRPPTECDTDEGDGREGPRPTSREVQLLEWIEDARKTIETSAADFPQMRDDLARQIAEYEAELIDVRETVNVERDRNEQGAAALAHFSTLVTTFRATASEGERLGFRAHRPGLRGLCYLCGGWTDSADTIGENSVGHIKPGRLFPTDDHVVPRSSINIDIRHVYGPNPDPLLVAAWEAIESDDNLRTAHMECNGRKGTRPLADLQLPFALPKGYDVAAVAAHRDQYDRLWQAWEACRNLTGKRYIVCRDDGVNELRRQLKIEIEEQWRLVRQPMKPG